MALQTSNEINVTIKNDDIVRSKELQLLPSYDQMRNQRARINRAIFLLDKIVDNDGKIKVKVDNATNADYATRAGNADSANLATLATSATSASKLNPGRDLKVDLGSTEQRLFNGSQDVTNIGVSGTLPVAFGGTGETSIEALKTKLGITSIEIPDGGYMPKSGGTFTGQVIMGKDKNEKKVDLIASNNSTATSSVRNIELRPNGGDSSTSQAFTNVIFYYK